MKNYVGPGNIIQAVVSADITSGSPLLIGDILGIACKDYASGETGDFAIDECFSIAKKSTDTFDPGQILFWDDTNKYLTETASTNKPVAISMGTYGSGVAKATAKLVPLTKDTTA